MEKPQKHTLPMIIYKQQRKCERVPPSSTRPHHYEHHHYHQYRSHKFLLFSSPFINSTSRAWAIFSRGTKAKLQQKVMINDTKSIKIHQTKTKVCKE